MQIFVNIHFRFWYHIYDPKPSSISLSKLNVKIVSGKNVKNLLEISKSKTDGWENATAFVGNFPGSYKVGEVYCFVSLHTVFIVVFHFMSFLSCLLLTWLFVCQTHYMFTPGNNKAP